VKEHDAVVDDYRAEAREMEKTVRHEHELAQAAVRAAKSVDDLVFSESEKLGEAHGWQLMPSTFDAFTSQKLSSRTSVERELLIVPRDDQEVGLVRVWMKMWRYDEESRPVEIRICAVGSRGWHTTRSGAKAIEGACSSNSFRVFEQGALEAALAAGAGLDAALRKEISEWLRESFKKAARHPLRAIKEQELTSQVPS